MADFDKQKISIGIAIGAIIFIMGSVATAAWWCATTTNKITTMQDSILAMRQEVTTAASDRYSVKDAARDLRDRDRVDGDLQRQLDKLQSDLAESRAAINRLQSSKNP